MHAAEGLRILIVEDDPDTRANLRDILELDDHSVEEAGTAAEALRRADWTSLAAIVLDRGLPDATADELLPRLRRAAPEAAVIVVTGYDDLRGAIVALRQGAADYILKPIDPDELRARIGNVVERRRVEGLMKQAQERALQAERLAAIGQMVAGLAHESRNALQRGQACLEMLALCVSDRPEALDLIGRLQRAQDHLHHLHDDVRAYAAPIVLDRRECDLAAVWREAWADLGPQRRGRIAAIREEIDDRGAPCVIDPFRLGQVFRNVLDNALSACDDPVEIGIRCEPADLDGRPALRVSVRDNGPGLDSEQRRRIFEPFFTTKTRGTGLGMAISKRIVEAHGGRVDVADGPAPGAEVVITVPRDQP